MTLFTNTPQITGSEAEELFSAGISLLSCKAYPAAYLCFNHIPNKDFRLLYNKALCCFMVKWHYPMSQGIPVSLAYRQLLRLKAETAFRLHLHSEVKTISARLGGKYKHIEKLIHKENDNDNL